MQYSHLTDDDLWCAITKNTNTMSTLFDPQFEAVRVTIVIDNLEREYLVYTAESELRCRHFLILNSEMPSGVRSDQAA